MTNKALHTITTIAAICLYNTSEKYLLPNGVPCWYLTNIIQKSMHNGLCKIKLKIRKQKIFPENNVMCGFEVGQTKCRTVRLRNGHLFPPITNC